MKFNILHDGILVVKSLDYDLDHLFSFIKDDVLWDNSISSRKTASYGVPYDYSNIKYEYSDFPDQIKSLVDKIRLIVGYMPNNCLINYYFENSSKMGFHSDQIDILEDGTGIIIISLGSTRKMRFKSKIDSKKIVDINIEANSFIYMTQEIQNKWLHAILPDKTQNSSERISITFRKIKLGSK